MNRQAGLLRPAISAALLGTCTLLSACDRTDLAGPPTLRLGRDECAECGMIISEDRCSAALLVEREGVREHALFDDLGCLADYEQSHAGALRVVDVFVHDHGSRAWVPARDATFVLTSPDRLPTPMGSGIVAFAERASAQRVLNELGGELMDYAHLGPARRAAMVARGHGRTPASQPATPSPTPALENTRPHGGTP